MKNNLSVLVVEDSLIFSEGMELILKQHTAIKEVYTAHNLKDTIARIRKTAIDIIFLDLNFETKEYDGFTIAKKVKEQQEAIKIIVLTQYARVYVYEKLFKECKVDAYLDKQLGTNELFLALEKVMQGEIYINSNIESIMNIKKWWKISKREKQVVPLLVQGYTQKEVADRLNISARTVENHITSIMRKLEVKNSVELAAKYVLYVNGNRENLEGGLSPF